MNKLRALEYILGTHNGVVEHSVFPFKLGGGVYLYHFVNGIKGTGFATYELVAFTGLDCDDAKQMSDEFRQITGRQTI